MDTTKKYNNPSPENKANIISKLFFCWLLPFFKYGYTNDLEVQDVFNTTKSDSSEDLADTLERHWLNEVRIAEKSTKKPSLQVAIQKTFWKPYAIIASVSLFRAIMYTFCMPTVLAEFINFFNSPMRNNEEGWFLGASVILMSFLNCVLNHHCNLYSNRIGMRIRIACSSLIYRKVLRLDKISLDDTDVGKLVNLLSNDVNRFDQAVGNLPNIWIMPFQATLGTYVMYTYVGVAAFAGIGTMILQAVPIQGTLSKLQGKLRYKIALRTDRRVKLMNEIVMGIQVIKMYAWEKPFENMVSLLRKYEIEVLTKTSYIKGISAAIMVFTERFTLYIIVVTYVLLGNELTGGVVFSMSQIINTLQLYICILFPMALSSYAETKTSIFRIEEFLTKSERPEIPKKLGTSGLKPGLVKLEKVHASWTPNPIVDTLVNLSFELKPGSFCCIIGNVGSGKSSILHLLLRELSLTSGEIQIGGSVSYASQESWLFASSVRNNILFGQPFYKEKYYKVIKACALQRDFELFPFGDKTNVGERGVSLSGGQRARINLARAVYRDADIYLFDDPLSAVDPHVAKHLVEKCILQHLHDKTRILVTHQMHFLNHADFILVLNNGKVEKFIRPIELSTNELKLLRQTSSTEVPPNESSPSKSTISLKSFGLGDQEELGEEPKETQELIERGSMSFSVYKDYYRAGASTFFLLIEILLLILAQTACNGGDLWVTFWTNNVGKVETYSKLSTGTSMNTEPSIISNSTDYFKTTMEPQVNTTFESFSTTETSLVNIVPSDASNNVFYIQVYTLFIVIAIVLTTLRSLLFYKICMNASINLHNLIFTNVLQATMRFFDTNPSGRILNRFSKDMGSIDELLPYATLMAAQVFLVAAGILSMTFIKSWWMIFPTIILGAILNWFRKVFMKAAQDVKRLEGITKAPVFSYVAASLDGLPTIRSANAEDMVRREFDAIQDQHTSTWYLFIAAFEAFGFYLDMVSILFLVIATVQFLLNDEALAGDVGLVISQSLIIIGMLQFGIRNTAEVSSHMTSVERVLQYTKLEKEGPFSSLPGNLPPRDWPEAGRITFKNVYLRYVPDEEPVLKNLTLEIDPGQKIGIVGRTGAGKSTLISALFRLASTEGSIEIDCVNILKVGLSDLRSKISIIPQEPILFSESVRYNLDPFGKSDDLTLWKVLDNVELKSAVDSLEMKVSEGGSNFSAGQRQLLCLARAIVRNNKILVMDEATANVDPQKP
ncbi:ATP-binding cassette sub-family C member 4-like isoform X2 [Coccinella septempunctata]|uniref:ATP-binding cassette sub-family C member 4-like isoform X2 n=1 Tax=Coccinella septempunctata TaxID=41139 RepID=UPI001D09383A|nr:ATP-binding cassette sub-family C member 4-like isoform X2 [Coccinella septempunctata]